MVYLLRITTKNPHAEANAGMSLLKMQALSEASIGA